MPCALAADAKLETPEGPLTVKTVGAAPTPVMVLGEDGERGLAEHAFAMSEEVHVVATAQPVLRLVLDTGRAVRLGAEQVLLDGSGVACRVGDLVDGVRLRSAFAFPVGYQYLTDAGASCVSDGCVGVASVGDGGVADIYSLRLGRGSRFVLSCGLVGIAAAPSTVPEASVARAPAV